MAFQNMVKITQNDGFGHDRLPVEFLELLPDQNAMHPCFTLFTDQKQMITLAASDHHSVIIIKDFLDSGSQVTV
jgi:hypothetical protein